MTHRDPLSARSASSQQGASHKYPRNEQRGTNLAPLTAAHAMCCLLSAWTMNIAITDCSVRAEACFGGMLPGMKASQFVRTQAADNVMVEDVISRWRIYVCGNFSQSKQHLCEAQETYGLRLISITVKFKGRMSVGSDMPTYVTASCQSRHNSSCDMWRVSHWW